MTSCSRGHVEIKFSCKGCPLCLAYQGVDAAVFELKVALTRMYAAERVCLEYAKLTIDDEMRIKVNDALFCAFADWHAIYPKDGPA